MLHLPRMLAAVLVLLAQWMVGPLVLSQNRPAPQADALAFSAQSICHAAGARGAGPGTGTPDHPPGQAHAGRIAWDGGAAPAGSIGYMPQDTGARVALTAFEVVLLGRMRSLAFRPGPADLAAAEAAMAEIGVGDLAARRIGELSGGQRQMVLLSQVLAGNPRVLLLDEPTGSLDIAHQLHVLDLLRTATRARGLTTIAVLHDLNAAARFADQVAVLHAGRLVGTGLPGDVLCPAMLEPAFAVRVAIDQGSDGHPVVLPLRAIRP